MRSWRSELAERAGVKEIFELAIKADDEMASLGARRTGATRAFLKALPDQIPKPSRKRRMTVSRAMKQAAEAGLTVKGVVVKPDGAVELQLDAAPDQPNSWHSI
jgi:hypothetical protein